MKAPWITRLGKNGEERFERTRFALQRMGGAALGSATTTVGSSFFLLFCTLQVFTKLGAVVIAVTFLSILFALLPLPAILVYGGPLRPGIKPIIQFVMGAARSVAGLGGPTQ